MYVYMIRMGWGLDQSVLLAARLLLTVYFEVYT